MIVEPREFCRYGLASDIKQLKVLHDVRIQPREHGTAIPCHAHILAARSPFFRRVLVDLDDDATLSVAADEAAVKVCMEYIYSGALRYPVDCVNGVFALATQWELHWVLGHLASRFGFQATDATAAAGNVVEGPGARQGVQSSPRGIYSLAPLLRVPGLLSNQCGTAEPPRRGVITLQTADNQFIPVSRAVLVARSGLFRKMLTGGWAESLSNSVQLPFPSLVVAQLAHFLYTDELLVQDPEALLALVEPAVYCDAVGLERAIQTTMASLHLDPMTAAELYIFAHAHGLDLLKEECVEFIQREWRATAANKEGWARLPEACLAEVLSPGLVEAPMECMRRDLLHWARAQVRGEPGEKPPGGDTEALTGEQEARARTLLARLEPPHCLFNIENRMRLIRGTRSVHEAFTGTI